MDPQGYGQFLIHLTGSLSPYIQIQTVFTIGSLLAIAPLSVVAARILDSLITGMAKGVADLHALPGYDGLRLLPTVLLDRRCSIRDAAIDKHVRMIVGQHTLNLTTFDR
jgi:hypothetical protein